MIHHRFVDPDAVADLPKFIPFKRSRAATLFNRTAHFNWQALEAKHDNAAVVDYRRFLVVKVLDDDLRVDATLRISMRIATIAKGARATSR